MAHDFDILQAPLSGFHLLDASAGTGKTYTLSGLFLRLILEKGLGVDEILVVTYTRAATGDLRTRIRERLADCLAALMGKSTGDPFINDCLAGIKDSGQAEASLYEALANFDEAAIFTIHGFCQRILRENSLETGTAFDLQVEPDVERIVRGIVLDFWRLTIPRLTPGLIAFAGGRLQPDILLRLAAKMRPEILILPGIDRRRLTDLLDGGALADKEERVRATVAESRDIWFSEGEEIRTVLKESEGLYKSVSNKLDGYFDQLNLFFADCVAKLPHVPEALEKLAGTTLATKTKKGHEPPDHPFFEICSRLLELRHDLEEDYRFLVTALREEALHFLAREQEERKEQAGVVSYDDLLLFLDRALQNGGDVSKRLAASIRRKYKAALIDEFQDTDPLQYRIFSRIYGGDRSTLLYIIGDPKQAIYSFRGADVYSYLEAVRAASSRESLAYNYRSEPGLIRAVNAVFSRRDSPFLFEEIPFSPVAPARKEDRDVLTVNGESEAPMRIWLARRPQEENGLINKPEAVQAVITALTSEICLLLERAGRGEIRIGDRPLEAGDIAVLVRKNKEAEAVKQGLEKVGVGGVVQSGADLFKSREAEELEGILLAVSEPANETAVRTALATDLFPETAGSLAAMGGDEERLAAWSLRFREYYRLWQARGFMAMFRTLLEREGMRQQCLCFSDGERRLTNLLHLGEILEEYTRHSHRGITSVLRYLSENRQAGGQVAEERQMRLESDEERVKIITIHTSKGLQYPVVFCPFSWSGMEVTTRDGVLFHRNGDLKPCLDLDWATDPVYLEAARRESLAEELRILYVALTRAINRCYLVWGPFNTADKSALAWLLHGSGDSNDTGLKKKSDQDILTDLQSLVDQAGQTVEISPPPDAECVLYNRVDEGVRLVKPDFKGSITADFRIASFSYMAGHGGGEQDRGGGSGYTSGDEQTPMVFPKGAKAGNFFHSLLEDLDFRAIARDFSAGGRQTGPVASLIEKRLQDYGYDPAWRDTAGTILGRTVTTPLNKEGLILSDINPDDRFPEMEFYFPLSPLSGRSLSGLLDSYGSRYAEMAALGFPELRGFMKGFIDLVFFYKGRYHILDWKTNYLGAELRDYQSRELQDVMVAERYVLQYLIYTVALHQFLSWRLPGYSYQDHFGGIYYLFLRGLAPEYGRECGVYYDLPPEALIRDLAATFSSTVNREV